MPLYRSYDGQRMEFSSVRGPSGPFGELRSECQAPCFDGDNPAFGPQCRRFATLQCDAIIDGGRLCGMPLCIKHGDVGKVSETRHKCSFHRGSEWRIPTELPIYL